MSTPSLFTDWPAEPPSVSGSATSIAAAKAAEPRAATDRRRVFDFIRGQADHGATDQEMQAALDLTGDSERPRRWELLKAGLIRDSGRTRQTAAGNKAVVWIITEKKS